MRQDPRRKGKKEVLATANGVLAVVVADSAAGEGDNCLEVKVYGNDIEKAIKILKRQIQKDGLLKEIKNRSFYEKPSVKEKRKRIEAQKKRNKDAKLKRKDRDSRMK